MVRVTALSGRMRSGKSTIAQHLIKHHGYTHLTFAGPIKQDIRAMGFPEWAVEQKPDWMRALMQKYGQAKRALDQNHWVDEFLTSLAWEVQDGTRDIRIVVDDLRFENEAYALRDLDPDRYEVELVKVFRIGDPGDVAHGSDQSEHDLDYWTDWDAIVQAASGDTLGLLQSTEKVLNLPVRS